MHASKKKQLEFKVKMYVFLGVIILFDILTVIDVVTIYTLFNLYGGLQVLSSLYLLDAIRSAMKQFAEKKTAKVTQLSSERPLESYKVGEVFEI